RGRCTCGGRSGRRRAGSAGGARGGPGRRRAGTPRASRHRRPAHAEHWGVAAARHAQTPRTLSARRGSHISEVVMDILVSFPGGRRAAARAGRHLVPTAHPAELGGEDAAPAPFDLFLASLATCAGIYVLGFCQARGLSTEGLALVQRVERDPATKLPARV